MLIIIEYYKHDLYTYIPKTEVRNNNNRIRTILSFYFSLTSFYTSVLFWPYVNEALTINNITYSYLFCKIRVHCEYFRLLLYGNVILYTM